MKENQTEFSAELSPFERSPRSQTHGQRYHKKTIDSHPKENDSNQKKS